MCLIKDYYQFLKKEIVKKIPTCITYGTHNNKNEIHFRIPNDIGNTILEVRSQVKANARSESSINYNSQIKRGWTSKPSTENISLRSVESAGMPRPSALFFANFKVDLAPCATYILTNIHFHKITSLENLIIFLLNY